MLAARRGHAEIVEALIDAGANLEGARFMVDLGIVEPKKSSILAVIDNGLKIRALERKKQFTDWLALQKTEKEASEIQAALNGKMTVVQNMINQKTTGLFMAVNQQNIKAVNYMIKEVIKAGGNLDIKDEHGKTALMLAVSGQHAEIVRALIDAGDNLLDMKIALRYLKIFWDAKSQSPILNAIAHRVEFINSKSAKLMQAVLNGNIMVVQTMIKAGTHKLNEKDKNTLERELMRAAMSGEAAIVQALLLVGAKLNEKDKLGKTALMLAARNGHAEIMRALINVGANLNEKDINGYTALMHATRSGHAEVVNILITAGANLDAKDKDGLTVRGLVDFFMKEPKKSETLKFIDSYLKAKALEGKDSLADQPVQPVTMHYTSLKQEQNTSRKEEKNEPLQSPKSTKPGS